MKMINQLFDQLAYITTEVHRATALFRDRFGVASFQVGKQVVDAQENGAPCRLSLKVAQAMMNGGELEIIEDRGSDMDLFCKGLPVDGGFGLRMHHVQFRITGSYEDWRRYIDAMKASRPPRLCPSATSCTSPSLTKPKALGITSNTYGSARPCRRKRRLCLG